MDYINETLKPHDAVDEKSLGQVMSKKYVMKYPSRYLLVQKHQTNVGNLFKVNSKDTRTTSLALFWYLYSQL